MTTWESEFVFKFCETPIQLQNDDDGEEEKEGDYDNGIDVDCYK